jgi:ABC-2 type transport system ATP-binding protein
VNDIAIRVEDVSKRFRVYHELNQTLKSIVMRRRRATYDDFWALRNVGLDIPQGSTFGLIGDNGSGKSTLLKTIARILWPDTGEVVTRGSIAALLEVGSGFHPELSGRDNVFLNGSILGMRRAEIERKFDEIVDFAGVGEFIDQPVKNYSSGMYVRLGFSVAIHVEPEILLVDEILAVGDAAFQLKCAEKFADFKREGRTVVLVSHSMPSLQAMCDEVAWLSHGELVEAGPAAPVLNRYLESTRTDFRVAADGAHHWGSGEITIEQVELTTGGAELADQLHTGDQLTVRLHYRADRRVDEAVFGLAIESADGTALWANNTRDTVYEISYVDGGGVVECQIASLALQSGTFEVVAAATDHTTSHVFDFVRGGAKFAVARRENEEMGGYVALGGTWDQVSGASS